MNPLSCFIVEDDPQALEYAIGIINELSEIHILGNAASIKDAVQQIQGSKPDFIILDVFLEDGNAFDFLKLFDHIAFKIIFTTSYSKYAIDAFGYSAVDYLLKPYQPEQLKKALERVTRLLDQEGYQKQLQALIHNFSNQNEEKRLILKNSDAVFVVVFNDILFAKSDNNYTTFYLKNNKTILVSGSLKSYEEKLKTQAFFRVHQSYLIQLQYVSSFHKKTETVLLYDQHTIPVAQSRKQELLKRLEQLN